MHYRVPRGVVYQIKVIILNSYNYVGFAVFKSIRLVGSYDPTQGVVEVFVDGAWGAICDDNLLTSTLGNAFAEVVCRDVLREWNINITNKDSPSPRHSYFRHGYDKYADLHRGRSFYYTRYFYDNLECTGTEESLKDCSYSANFDICISGRNVAAVKCNDVTTTGDGKLNRVSNE